MKNIRGFIRLVTDKDYDEKTHRYTEFVEVALRIKNISEIIEYMPDDPEYNNTKVGSKIIMTNGDEYLAMDWTIDELFGLIDLAS